MKKAITPLKNIPTAFEDVGKKVNELVANALPLKAGTGIKVTETEQDVTISTTKQGMPDGFTFEEFTICDSGTPATRWIPTWTSDPTVTPT